MITKFVQLLSFLTLFNSIHLTRFSHGQDVSRPDINFDLRNLRINFSIPGARANGLGGAFISVADDATAAAINPAGLTFLAEPEFSVVNRINRFTHDEIAGTDMRPDQRNDFHDSGVDQSYAALVYPHNGISFAFYREELIDLRSSYSNVQFLTIETNDPLALPLLLGGPGNFPGRINDLEIEVANWGGAMALRLNNHLRVGFSLALARLDFEFSERLFFDSSFATIHAGEISPAGNTPGNLYLLSTIDNTKTEFSYNVGILASPFTSITIGVVYNGRPTYELENNVFFPTFFVPDTDPSDEFDESFFIAPESRSEKIAFQIPDSFGFGASYRVTDNLTLALDFVRIEYSDLLKKLDTNLTDDDIFDSDLGRKIDPNGRPDLTIADAVELHLGAEYIFHTKSFSIPVSGGFYTDPDHVVFTPNDDENLRRRFPKGENQFHFTGGLGITLKDKFTFDVALNVSDDIFEFLQSVVIRF